MKTPNFDELSKRIEQLIAAHMEQCRNATLQAVGRAFSVTAEATKSPPSTASATTCEKRKIRTRRNAEELAGLSQKLHTQVRDAPGATMAALALKLQLQVRELQLPMNLLKGQGKVRHVGERAQTRYFPQADNPQAVA